MTRSVGIAVIILALATGTGAGEILFANGSRLSGELADEVLLFSTGSELIEVAPEHVGQLTPEAVYLTDGRVLRGTLVGGRVRTRTPLGELSIGADELRHFRVDGFVAAADASVTPPESRSTTDAGMLARVGPGGESKESPPRSAAAREPAPAPAPPSSPGTEPTVVASTGGVTTVDAAAPRLFEVTAAQSPLYRDALQVADQVGRVVRGERVAFVDFIDRRLRIFNRLIFDGGHWIRVRAPNGTIGWLPAAAIREVR